MGDIIEQSTPLKTSYESRYQYTTNRDSRVIQMIRFVWNKFLYLGLTSTGEKTFSQQPAIINQIV